MRKRLLKLLKPDLRLLKPVQKMRNVKQILLKLMRRLRNKMQMLLKLMHKVQSKMLTDQHEKLKMLQIVHQVQEMRLGH